MENNMLVMLVGFGLSLFLVPFLMLVGILIFMCMKGNPILFFKKWASFSALFVAVSSNALVSVLGAEAGTPPKLHNKVTAGLDLAVSAFGLFMAYMLVRKKRNSGTLVGLICALIFAGFKCFVAYDVFKHKKVELQIFGSAALFGSLATFYPILYDIIQEEVLPPVILNPNQKHD